MFNQNDALLTLSYLLGEQSVPPTQLTARGDFIQSTLDEAYTAYPWRFATRLATLVPVSGIATLPTNVDISQEINLQYFNGTTPVDMQQVDIDDIPLSPNGKHNYWLTTPSEAGPYVVNTLDAVPSNFVLKYQTIAPILNSTLVQTAYPNKNTIALGARRYVKLSQNPDADISQDEALFQTRLNSDIAAHQVAQPRKKRRTKQARNYAHTGDF